MNKFKLIPIVIIVLFAISLSMCTKDDKTVAPGILPTQVNTAIVVGTWDITLYDKAGTDHTSDFSEYSFAFNVNDTVVATAATSKKVLGKLLRKAV